jgi:hypothetical protein
MQEIRRFKPSTVSRRFSVAAGSYRTCVIDGLRSSVLSGDTSLARVGAPASYSFVTISLPSLDPSAGNELAKEPNTIRSGVALRHVRTRVGREFRVAGTSF